MWVKCNTESINVYSISIHHSCYIIKFSLLWLLNNSLYHCSIFSVSSFFNCLNRAGHVTLIAFDSTFLLDKNYSIKLFRCMYTLSMVYKWWFSYNAASVAYTEFITAQQISVISVNVLISFPYVRWEWIVFRYGVIAGIMFVSLQYILLSTQHVYEEISSQYKTTVPCLWMVYVYVSYTDSYDKR